MNRKDPISAVFRFPNPVAKERKRSKMKRVLITGAGSYIGTSFDRYLKENYPDKYEVDTVDMLDGSWRQKSFGCYDSVFHVAGIAHSDNGKISEEMGVVGK